MFLLYLLARLLGERKAAAVQISSQRYVLFTEQGASMHKGDSIGGIPADAWALSDSMGTDQTPCSAFQFSDAHLVHTSSPAARKWKEWKKQLGATIHVMDIWSEEEFKCLLYVGVVYSVLH